MTSMKINSYTPTSTHYVVSMYPGAEIIVEIDQCGILVDGRSIGQQGAQGGGITSRCIRIALEHTEPETDWSEGGEAWEDVSWEVRSGGGVTL